jgi:hypothetical protein
MIERIKDFCSLVALAVSFFSFRSEFDEEPATEADAA